MSANESVLSTALTSTRGSSYLSAASPLTSFAPALWLCFPSIVVIKVAQLGVYKALLHRGAEETVQRFFLLLMLLAGHLLAIQLWTRPFPGTSTTLPEALNQTANILQSAVSQGTDEQLMTSVDQEYQGIVQFVVKQSGQIFDYNAARAVMVLFEFIVFGVIVYSYGGFAVGAMFGPLMIPCALFGRTAGWFDRWLSAFVGRELFDPSTMALTVLGHLRGTRTRWRMTN